MEKILSDISENNGPSFEDLLKKYSNLTNDMVDFPDIFKNMMEKIKLFNANENEILQTLKNNLKTELREKYFDSLKETNSIKKRILFLNLIEFLDFKAAEDFKTIFLQLINLYSKDLDFSILLEEKEKYCLIINSIYDIYFLSPLYCLDQFLKKIFLEKMEIKDSDLESIPEEIFLNIPEEIFLNIPYIESITEKKILLIKLVKNTICFVKFLSLCNK